jgi:hypothetical protein
MPDDRENGINGNGGEGNGGERNGGERNGGDRITPFSSVLGKLDSYDGKGDIKRFLKQLKVRASLENWSEKHRVEILKYLCIGNAEAFVESQPDLEECSFEQLSKALIHRFKPVVSKQQAYSHLTSLKQNNLSVKDFVGHIDEVSASFTEVLTELSNVDSREAFKISIFTNGLNYEIRKVMGVAEYEDYEVAVQGALRAEKLVPSKKLPVCGASQARAVEPQEERPEYDAPPKGVMTCFYCKLPGHIKRNCPSLPPRPNYPTRHPQQYSYYPPNSPPSLLHPPYLAHPSQQSHINYASPYTPYPPPPSPHAHPLSPSTSSFPFPTYSPHHPPPRNTHPKN